MDFMEVLPSDGAWPVLAVLLLLVFGPVAVLSQKGSERFWIIGRLAKWVKDRKVREIRESSSLAEATMAAHEEDRKRWRHQMKEVRDEMEMDRERFRREMDAQATKMNHYWQYILHVAEFSRTLSMLAAKYGWEPAPPRLDTFDEWEDSNHRGGDH